MSDYIGAIPVVTLELIQQSIMRARLAGNTERKNECVKRLDYYKGDQLDHLDNVLREQFKHPEKLKLQKQFSNITRRIINEVSVVYKRAPQRRLMVKGKPVEGEPTERFQKLYENACADVVLKKVNRYTNLLQTVGVQVCWRNDRVELDILTPDILNVVQNPQDPTAASAVIIEQAFADTVMLDSPGNPYGATKLFIAWTPEQHQVFDQSGVQREDLANADGRNPYGIMPFVWFRAERPDGFFWNEGGADLIVAQEAVNVKLTYLNQLIKMQSFSIAVFTGNPPEGVTVDPTNYVVLPLPDAADKGQPDFKFVTPDPKIKEVLEALAEDVRRIADDWGLSMSNFTLSGSPSSGLSLKLQNVRLIERREDDLPLYNDYEKQLFNVMRRVHNTHCAPKDKLPEDAEISVNFAELEFPEDPAAEDARWVTRINQNVVSRADWLRSIDPDIKSEEEAEKRLEEIAEFNSRTRGGMGDPAALAAALGMADPEGKKPKPGAPVKEEEDGE